ncbi:MAG: guanylate kinase [Coriobacteriales bacterium]|nr:guanylate kinase [Coriobacteriales bacterium]
MISTPPPDGIPRSLFVISGPAGVGKGTLIARAKERMDDIWVSISATTRHPRGQERDGVEYFFKSEEEFQHLIENDGLLEWAEVHGKHYGTPKDTVLDHIARGECVFLEIDTQGAFQVRDRYPEAVLIFIAPPSFEVLEQRLRGRGTETEEQVLRRLQTAELELSRMSEYDVVIVNDELETAVDEFVRTVSSLRHPGAC